MFFDDRNLFISHENIDKLFQEMNKTCVSAWFKVNKLSINIDQTKWTFFHRTSKKCFIFTKFPELFIDGTTLERETVTILCRARLIIPRKHLN